jgi:uncharacterized protein (DUF4415 family)
MPKRKAELLSAKDKKEIERRRVEAQKWARRFLHERIDEAEEAKLIAAAESDSDNPPLTDKQFSRMRPAHEVAPQLVARQLRKERGRPKAATTKQQVTLRIDRDVLEKFRAQGDGWQSRINEVLRKAVKV